MRWMKASSIPGAIGAAYPLPLLAVRTPDRMKVIAALRRFEHGHSTWPFGAELHYTDRRAAVAPDAIVRELQAYLDGQGFTGVEIAPIAPGIEDAFIHLMGAPDDAPAATDA